MAKDELRDLIGYEALQQEALRGVIRAALAMAAGPNGLPGEHHFYISFLTQAPGVAIPEELRGRYPEDMTIVLQNQFWDLDVADESFSVSLSFDKKVERLTVPFAAIKSFADPSVEFALAFAEPAAPPSNEAAALPAPAEKPVKAVATPAEKEERGQVVALDAFRKR